MEKTGYNITQEENGLRKFGPPPGWIGPPPPKGSDIFIGKLPRDVFEDELVPLCEQFGKIYELRLMMNFNGENRGYAFITYTNNYDATKAIKHLDDFEIKPGRHIGACKAIDNCRLFVGGIPKDKTREEIMAEISKYTEGVSKVILYSSIMDKSKNRGFAFLEYETHRAAALARRKLLASKIKLFDHEIAVYWAQPEAHVEEETMKRLPGQMVPETLDGYACEGYPEREEEEPVEEIEWNVEETRTELDDSDDDTESDDEPSKIQVFFEEWKRFFCGPSHF